jgi:hypothetical protein
MIGALIHILVIVIILGLVFWLLWWAMNYLPLPQPFAQIARFLIVLIFALILIYLLLPLANMPMR